MTDPYNALVREYFANPQHAGLLSAAPSGWYEDQGIRLHLSVEIDGETVSRARFKAYGCPHVIAACEYLCREFEGQPVAAIEGFESARIMQHLGVPAEKTGRILVVEDTVRSLWAAIQDRSATD